MHPVFHTMHFVLEMHALSSLETGATCALAVEWGKKKETWGSCGWQSTLLEPGAARAGCVCPQLLPAWLSQMDSQVSSKAGYLKGIPIV